MPKSDFRPTFWTMSKRLLEIYSWIFANMVNKNYNKFSRTRPNKGFISPISPKITEKKEKREKERKVRKND